MKKSNDAKKEVEEKTKEKPYRTNYKETFVEPIGAGEKINK